jgi:excisionase family DNA binding protein
MIGSARSACLLPLRSDLRHHRAMDTEGSDGKNPWFSVSAWLPPGLALAWLATLATLMRGVGMALAAWGATVSAVLLAILLAQRLRRGGSDDGGEPTAGDEDGAAEGTEQASTPFPVATPVVPGSPIPELRVLTAEQAASLLGVEAEVVKASISSGEFPGNRIGTHWLVEQGALARWLQGTYRS